MIIPQGFVTWIIYLHALRKHEDQQLGFLNKITLIIE